MKIEQNEINFWNGWIYIQMPTFFICMEAYIIDDNDTRRIDTDFVYKGEGNYFDDPPLTRINLSADTKEWIKEKWELLKQTI